MNRLFLFLVLFFPLYPSDTRRSYRHQRIPKIEIAWILLSERLPTVGDIVMLKEDTKIRVVRYQGQVTLNKYSKSTHWGKCKLALIDEGKS